MSEDNVEIKRGLRDIYIDRTESSFIDGKNGKLLYRGYNIHDLAENSSFEETAYLLLYGSLPTQSQLDVFDLELRSSRRLPDEVEQIIRLTANSHPMDVLRTTLSALAAYDPDTDNNSPEATLRKGLRLTAQAPTKVATHARLRNGLDPVEPSRDLGHAANFLYMLFAAKPYADDAALIDKDFPVIVVATPGRSYEKTLSNMEEVRARGGKVIAVGCQGDERVRNLADFILPVPQVPELLAPLVNVVPLQLLAYQTALLLGRDIDQPRNLAKSVTVE